MTKKTDKKIRLSMIGYLDPDCLKCGKCTLACPTKIMTLKH